MISDDTFPVEPWQGRETRLDLNILAQWESLLDWFAGTHGRCAKT